jgi:tripartite-type tricarboxylate transporter receptor subunit TctC
VKAEPSAAAALQCEIAANASGSRRILNDNLQHKRSYPMRGSANWHAWRVAAAASLSAAGASQNVKAKEGLAVATADQALAVDNFTLGLATRQRGLAGLRLATIAQVLGATLVITAHWAGVARPAQAQDTEPFYKGKTIHLIVGYSPGGGYDLYARLLSKYMGRYIPGNPAIVINNMPGAATLKALEFVESKGPTDGTMLVMFDFFQIGRSLLEPDRVKLDFRRDRWIGSLAEDVSVCYLWAAHGAKTIADAKREGREWIFGLTAPGAFNEMRQKMLKNLLHVKIRTVAGYPGSAEEKIAIERGEIDGACGGWSSIPADWVKQKKINVLVRYVPDRPADMDAVVPYAVDLVSDAREKQIIEFLAAPAQLGKPIIANKAVPADRAKLLQDAFAKAVADPELLAEAQSLRLDISPKTAAEASKIIDDLYKAPPDIVAGAVVVYRLP